MKLTYLRKYLLLCGVVLFTSSLSAQEDSTYLRRLEDQLVLTPFVRFRAADVSLKRDTAPLLFHPSEVIGLGLRLTTRLFGLSATIPLHDFNQERVENPMSVGLGGFLRVKGWTLYGSSRYLKGMNAQLNGNTVFRADIRWLGLEGGGIYAWNHERYRFNAPIRFPGFQLKSAGSVLLMPMIQLNHFWSDSTITFPVAAPELPDFLTYRSLGIGLGLGYGYNWTSEHWHAGIAVIPAIKLYSSAFLRDQKQLAKVIPSFAPRAHIAFGRHWKGGFWGVNADYEGNFIQFGTYGTENNRLTAHVWLGFLVREPRFFRKIRLD